MHRLEAHLEGFRTADLDECLDQAQILVTVTGRDGALTLDAIMRIRDGCILANAGHFSSEIEVDRLESAAISVKDCRDGVKEYQLDGGRRVFLLTDGNLVNLAAGDGNPIEIMDLGLALQSLSLEQMALLGRSVAKGVHPVSLTIEREVCSLALHAWV